MSCQVTYNTDGSIKTVLDKAGNESKLFLSIAKLPMVNSLEEALDIYRETYAKGIADTSEIVITEGFESNLRTALSNIKDKSVKNVKGWINQLNDTQKTGVRYTNQEIEWIGLEDYLKEWTKENKPKNGNIPFEVVDQYVKDNQIEVSEVVKGNLSEGEKAEKARILSELNTIGTELILAKLDGNREEVDRLKSIEDRLFKDLRPLSERTNNEVTKYSQYTLEGGENYREILLILPLKKDTLNEIESSVIKANSLEQAANTMFINFEYPQSALDLGYENGDGHISNLALALAQYNGDSYGREFLEKQLKAVAGDKFEEAKSMGEKALKLYSDAKISKNRDDLQYRSSHWDERNILAHIRMNERTLSNGERVLFIEEIQSDWAQEGKKKGFNTPFNENNVSVKFIDSGDKIEIYYNNEKTETLSTYFNSEKEALDFAIERERRNQSIFSTQKISNMPYKKTDQWVGMAMRRVFQMAAQEGFDRVSWVTGEQSAKRYDLSQQIESIAVIGAGINDGVNKRVTLIPRNSTTINMTVGNEGEVLSGDFTGKNLADVIGKELAERVVDSPDDVRTRLEGTDLEVGGEGMKAFYNQIVPKVALKEAQRFDKKSKIDVANFNEQPLKVVEFGGRRILVNNKTGELVDSQYGSRFSTDEEYINAFIDGFTNSEGITVSAKGASKQLSIKLTPRAKATLLGAVPLFQKNSSSEKVQRPKDVIDSVVETLKKTGLAKNVTVLDNQGIVDKLIELGVPSETAYQVIAYHGRTRPINNFEREGKKRNKFGEVLSGVYFGEPYIAAAFAGVDNFSGNDNANVAKVSLDDSSFYTVDMKGTTPSGDVSLINTIGQKEWDKIKALKDSGQIKGLKLLNTREFLVGEEGPTTQYVVYDTEVIDILKEYKGAEVNRFVPRLEDFLFQKGINVTPQGFVYNGEVYINKDGVDPVNTAIHEFGHLWNSWAQKNIPQVYQKGIDLIKEQGQEYIDFVKKNQPNLSGEALYEEALAQAIGDNGAKIVEASRKESIMDWLKSLWDSIKSSLGISKVADISNMTLDEFAGAVATDLLKGESLTSEMESIKERAISETEQGLDEVAQQLQKTELAKGVNILSPQQIEQELVKRGVDAKLAKQVSVWHGSPHLFDKFSLSAMGTGEGAQAFGWGAYFTDLESIARSYAKELSITTFRGEKIDEVAFFEKLLNGLDANDEPFYNIDKGTIKSLTKFRQYVKDTIEYLEQNILTIDKQNEKYQTLADKYTYQNLSVSDLKADIDIYKHFVNVAEKSNDKNDMVNRALPTFKAKADAARRMLIEINRGKKNRESILSSIVEYDLRMAKSSLNYYKYIDKNFDAFNISRNLYKTTLHKGKQPSEYTWLEWDKELDRPLMVKILSAIAKSKNEDFDADKFNSSLRYRSDAYDKYRIRMDEDGKGVYFRLSKALGGDKQASLFLLRSGIDGIKYPAESISRGATSDNARGFNYVVFDENAITIEEVIQFQKAGIGVLPNGFVDLKTKEVFLNKETANLDTPIHEFSHLYTNLLKQTNPDLYRKGLELIEKEGQEYINFVKQNQPNLEGEALLEEALTQAVGEAGAKIVNKQSSFFQWLQDMWNSFKDMLGLSQYSWDEVRNMSLQEYTDAVAVDLLRGEELRLSPILSIGQELQQIKDEAIANGTFMKAPNGKGTNLNERQWLQVRSKAFRDWFGDWENDPKNASKTLDTNGEPLVFYHGSPHIKDIDIFNNPKGTFFFSTNIGEAYRYTTKGYAKDEVGQFFINSRKALDIRDLFKDYTNTKPYGEKLERFLIENSEAIIKEANDIFFLEKEMDDVEEKEYLLDYYEDDASNKWDNLSDFEKIDLLLRKGSNDWKILETNTFLNFLKENYDGFVTNEGDFNLAVFNPNQIKSATENQGTFSSENDDIRFSINESLENLEDFKKLLKNGFWGMLTAKNPDAQQDTNENNIKNNKKAKQWLSGRGYKFKEIKGKYGNEENSFLVPNLTSSDAVEFAREFKQESVATNQGLVYQDGTMNPINKGNEVIGGEFDDFYSTIKLEGKDVNFSVDYDFSVRKEVIDNNSIKTQDFFSDVVTGTSDKFKPLRPWTPQLKFSTQEKEFLSKYEEYKGNFDEHIATSIPTFRELQVKVGTAIKKLYSSIPKDFTQELLSIKDNYKKSRGLTNEPVYIKVDQDFFKELSDYHRDAVDDRSNREMKASYRAFLDETKSQYKALVDAGYTIEPWMGEGEPYGVDSNAVREDVINNKHLYYLRSKSATGDGNENESAESYLPFEDSGITINGDQVLMNDLFRAVHDIMGHVMAHNSFSTQGEYDAYHTHAPMYSEKAQKALFLETVVYNAWYSENKNYAPRKIYNIPQEFLDRANEKPLIYDIGGSEGGFVKTITEMSDGNISSINLDVNPDMQAAHENSPVKGSEFVREAFYESFEDDGVTYKKHVPKEKADVVHESMVFQFISPKRDGFVKEVKDNYIKEDGVFLTEEKLIPSDEKTWLDNEREKDQYKLQYYAQEQLDKKSEEVLVGMKKNQTLEADYVRTLKNNFKYVVKYWDATNFKGYAASDSKEKLDAFMDNLGGEVVYNPLTATNTTVIEPQLSFKDAESYSDALNKEQDIEIGIETTDGFKTLLTIPYNVNPETRDGFINKYIKEGLLNEQKTLYKGKQYFTIKGTNAMDKKSKELILADDLTAMLGADSHTIKEGMIDVKEEDSYKYSAQEINIINDLASELIRANKVKLANSRPKKLSEKELKLKLMTLLNKLGIETLSIADYVEKYKVKNGVDPSVRALADSTNRVVAFKDGIITLEDLTEEVMHIIVESLPSEQVENILRNIHRTTEYAQDSQRYREAYTKAYPKMSKEQIEQLVRKEILGKVLKNSTLENVESNNFYDKAADFISSFFNRISENKELRDQLKNINGLIEQLFIQENLEDYLDGKIDIESVPMYSLGNATSGDTTLDLARSLQKAVLNALKQSYASIDKGSGTLYADKIKMQRYGELIDTVSQATSASDFLGVINRQVQFVQNGINEAKAKDTALPIEIRQVIINLNDSLRKLLERQKDVTLRLTPKQLGLVGENETVSSEEAQLRKETLVKKIDETVSSIGWVTGQAANIEDITFNDIINRIKIRQNLSDSQSEFLRSQAEMMNKEIGFFMETFGQLTQASDGLLNVAANVVEEMWGKHASLTQKTFRKFTKVMEENGVEPKQLTELFRDGFLLNPYDFNEFNKEVLSKDVEVYNEIFSENISIEEYEKAKKENTLKQYDAKQQLTASRPKNEKMADLVERRMNDDYYRKQAEKYEKLGISKYTIDQLKALSLQRAIIQNEATDADGKVIYTEYNKNALDSLSQMRKEYKATVDSLGTLKQGYNEMTKEEATTKGIDIFNPSNEFIEIGNLIYTLNNDASNEARLSFELHLIDNNFERTEKRTNTQALIEKFVDISNDLGMEKGIEFLENNLGLSFSTDFWDSISTENILDNIDVNLIEGNPETIKRIRQKRNKLSQLKKLFQDPMNPQEVKGYEMKPSEQEVIKNLVEEIDLEMKNLVIPDSVTRETDFDSEVSVNQSYKDALSKEVKEELSKEEFNFIRKHVTSINESYLVGLENKAKSLDEGRGNISEKTKEKLESYMQEGDTYYQGFVRLARTRLLPYYKRFTPKGYKTISDITSELTSDEIKQGKVIEYISQLENDPNYELNIHYTFNSEAKDINPNWDKNFKGGYYQPKLSKFLDKKFVEMFDPEIVDGKFTGTVRKNQNLYNVQQALVELQSTNLEFIGHEGSTNVYKLPQISRTRTNQVIDLVSKSNKGRTFKEILKDTFNYRIDDLEYGDKENEVDIQKATDSRTVPTFYTRDLENKEDLSDDLFYTFMAMTNQSALHKVRRDGLTDILAVEDKMINRSTANGKNAQATRNYKMLKSYIDFNYYGMQETRAYKVKLPIIDKEIDLTRVLRQINSYVKLRNLGLNVIVPFTSYITGEVNLQIEATLGEYFSRDSLRLASKEFSKLFKETGFVQNSLSYNDKSKLNVLGEYLGVYNQSEKAGNAKYPTMMRWLAKSGMVLHQVGNLPIIPRIYLSILFDHRVINGAIVSRKQFDAGYTDKKQAESEWKSYENNSLYHYLDIKDTGVEIKPKLLSELNGDQEYLDNKIQKIKSLIKDQVQKIDGQIPESQRVNAQRDAVFNYFMTHRGWFAIAAQRRLKGLQLNLETGQMEEGTYVTLKNLIFDMFGEVGSGNDKTWNFVKAFKKAYEGSRNDRDAELVARNMKRVGVEFAFMTGIVMVLAAVTAMADDEDNKDLYALQLTNYFLWRLANETSSTQLGLFTEASNIIKTPVVGYQQVIDMTKVGQIFDTDELKSGTYKGHTGTYKYFFKNTVGLKGLHDLMNIRTTENTYEYYNRENLEFSSMGLFSLLSSED